MPRRRACRMFGRILVLALWMSAALGASARLQAQTTFATIAINGAEASPASGNISVSFNGFIEIVRYGQFSTGPSLAAALAAQFSHDYYGYGLGAKAGYNPNGGFNLATANVITFSLPAGQSFGSLDDQLPGSPFSLVPTGFASNGTTVADTGTVTLTAGGQVVATANYGDGTTPEEIAQKLVDSACTPPQGKRCSPLDPASPVTVQAAGEWLYLTAAQTGVAGDIPYSLALQSNDTADFPTPSFEFTPPAGTLSGGAASGTSASGYSYSVTAPGGGSGYAANGNLLALQDSVMGNWSYTYDPLNRLTGANQTGAQLTGIPANPHLCWSYDNAGNRTAQAVANQSFSGSSCQLPTGASGTQALTTYVGSSSNATTNRIASFTATGQSASATVAYDGNGNITSDGVNAYLYDAEDRLCAVHGAYGMVGYQYDAEGNRIGKGSITSMSCDITVNGYQAQSDYILDQGGGQETEMAVDAIGTEVWQHTNVWADGQLVATYDTAGQHFYFNDALGSRRYQTDFAGAWEQTCQSLPFGDNLQCSGSTSAPTEHHFTGKERDPESGLDFFMARYYASNMGRFMSPDWSAKEEPVPYGIMTDPQSLDLYVYVLNNPTDTIDQDGHLPWKEYFKGALDGGNDVLEGVAQAGLTTLGVIVADHASIKRVYHGVEKTVGDGIFLTKNAREVIKTIPIGWSELSPREQSRMVTGLALNAGVALLGPEAEVEETGVVYRRTNPVTGEEYIGQSQSLERYTARQGEHNSVHQVDHEYEILERGRPGKDLNVKEETHIRRGGGPSKKGGKLANKRYQMSDKAYRKAGGTSNKPTK